MATVAYDYDPTGRSPDNFIPREPHLLTEINDRSKRTLVLKFSPFYRNNFLLEHRDVEGKYSVLAEGIDYDLSLRYLGASDALGIPVFGGVTIHTSFISGTLLVSYQTIGGKWTGDRELVLENLASAVFNPRIGSWDAITNVPEVFPPSPHQQPIETFKGFDELIAIMNRLTNKLGQPVPPSLLYQEQTLRILTAYEGLSRRLETAEDEIRRLNQLLNR